MNVNMHVDAPFDRITPTDGHYFFGYYDKCPWNRAQDKIIACRTPIADRLPDSDDRLTIGFMSSDGSKQFTPVAETRAWNFQQGAMAQWFYGDEAECILFNIRRKEGVATSVVDLSGRVVSEYPVAIYAVSPDWRWGVSVDFGRLALLRPGYGYMGVGTRISAELFPRQDGLVRLDLRTGATKLLISYAQLAETVLPRGVERPHWIDHIEFSPDGKRIVFLHRWLAKDGGPLTRVMSLCMDGEECRCLLDCGSAGHGLWLGAYKYGIWGRLGTAATVARASVSRKTAPLRVAVGLARRILPDAVKRRFHRESFLILDTDGTNPACSTLQQIPFAWRGGHPSVHPSGSWLVSDTIPDRKGRRHLFLVDLDTSCILPVLTVAHERASANAPFRCDLHPRWNRDGSAVCVDSIHDGCRGMFRIDMSGCWIQHAHSGWR